ncbi:MAG: Gfo/Idh/MocA family protein [Chloroflexota bacterium]
MTPIGLGFAGVGWLGESLIRELSAVAGLELVGVQDTQLERAQAVSARHGHPWAGQRFDDLLQLPGVDAVVICTPNALHVPQATQALQAGKHVLVQKPLALSFADAQATVELARSTGRMLFVDYTYRFLATVTALQQALVKSGRVRAIRAEFHNIYGPGVEKTWFFDPQLSGGGALIDLGVHLLDLALWLVEPRAVRLEHAEIERGGIEHTAALRLHLGDDIPFELAVSWNAPLAHTRIAFELECDRGRLSWQNVDGSFYRFRTLRDRHVLMERETTLRSDTLRAFASALRTGAWPAVDTRVYALLEQAYHGG